ncbi:hypothetical protein PHYPSEUDO_007046 [Phytophthora pseudosyringae]|uniref:Uncharacterized protein n=1 Tax=Phytophthora pseudosyringae TaxID=221518 RepID=A0A8T1VHU6_9STRA|nr:hypothetical protein PHYPSEUDO_007046 [Phytophthora pseudosyringae]
MGIRAVGQVEIPRASGGAAVCETKTKQSAAIVAALPKSVTAAHEAVVVGTNNAKAEEKNEEGKQGAKTVGAIQGAESEGGQNNEESAIDLQLRQVERALKDGDQIWGLNVAKARFQAMLDAFVSPTAEYLKPPVLSKASTADGTQATEDPIAKLCDPNQRSVDQTRIIKTRLRDTIAIIDATLCKPPHDHFCSRDCRAIRAQLCNEFTPCINPTCRAWHAAEAHILALAVAYQLAQRLKDETRLAEWINKEIRLAELGMLDLVRRP